MSFNPHNPARIGLIGAGNISRRYVNGISRFPQLSIVGCADKSQEMANRLATEFGLIAYPSTEALLADPLIDVVVNLTPPAVHASVSIAALRAGKHVYVEKPIATTLTDADQLLKVAHETGLVLGVAPDTFLGSAGQTVRSVIDSGIIGDVVGAVAFVTSSRVETWHPNPAFLFEPGGGPALDMGPYYIASLVNALGPVETVCGISRIGSSVLQVSSPDRTVDELTVTTPTHISASLRFHSGAIVTVLFSFDVWDHHLPHIEIYGTKGALSVPDPNQFDGDVLVRRHEDTEWRIVDPVQAVSGDLDMQTQMLRGVGVADLVGAINGHTQLTRGELAFHVLEVLEAMATSSSSGKFVTITSQIERPALATSEHIPRIVKAK